MPRRKKRGRGRPTLAVTLARSAVYQQYLKVKANGGTLLIEYADKREGATVRQAFTFEGYATK